MFICLISLSIIHSRSIYFVADGKILIFLISNIAFYVFMYVCSTSSLSIHLLINIYIASMSWLLFLDQLIALQRIPCDIFFSLLLPLKFFKKFLPLKLWHLCESLSIHIVWDSLCLLYPEICFLSQVQEVFSPKHFRPFSLSFPSRIPKTQTLVYLRSS